MRSSETCRQVLRQHTTFKNYIIPNTKSIEDFQRHLLINYDHSFVENSRLGRTFAITREISCGLADMYQGLNIYRCFFASSIINVSVNKTHGSQSSQIDNLIKWHINTLAKIP